MARGLHRLADEDGNIVALEILDASGGFDLRDLFDDYDLAPWSMR
jgi:hypothetical protein